MFIMKYDKLIKYDNLRYLNQFKNIRHNCELVSYQFIVYNYLFV